MIRLKNLLLGAICDHDVALNFPIQYDWNFETYEIVAERPSNRRISDSALSTPARYIQEIFIRLSELRACQEDGPYFVFNPLFATTRASLLSTVAVLCANKHLSGPAVLVDRHGLPAGYLLPPLSNAHEVRYLGLLSAVDGAHDAELLECIYLNIVQVIKAPRLWLSRHGRNGFDDPGLWTVYDWITRKAITLFKSVQTSNPLAADQISVRLRRDRLPFTAIMTHHAGDALFISLAFNHTSPGYQRIAVSRTYSDIVRRIAPRLSIIEVEAPIINRDSTFASGKISPDCDYFQRYKDELPDDSFYTFCRLSRNYNSTNFHLIDHFAFALGYSPRSDEDLVIHQRAAPERSTVRNDLNIPARILLHFDGGWPLKVYPTALQTELIELLLLQGFKVTVLAPPGYSHPGIESVSFRSLEEFIELAYANDLLVGMDSFPSHYCAHVIGLPTICLFASTKPANSNASPSGHYAFLEMGLGCRPCYAVAECPVYGGNSCRNFVAPQLVLSQIESLLTGHYSGTNACLSIPLKQTAPRSMMTIHMHYVELQAWFATFIPPMSYWATLFNEFSNAIHREGLLPAFRRTWRFLIKKIF